MGMCGDRVRLCTGALGFIGAAALWCAPAAAADALQLKAATGTTAAVTVYYRNVLEVAPAVEGLTWAVVDGAPPPGLELVGNEIRGIPTEATTALFTVRATDPVSGASGELQLGMYVYEAPTIEVSELAPARQGFAYSETLRARGGEGPYEWKLVGRLPPGLSLEADRITGIPQRAGTSSFDLRVLDRHTAFAERAFEIDVGARPMIEVPEHLEAQLTVPFDHLLVARRTVGDVRWELWGGLPDGLKLVGDTLTGTPLVEGEYRFTVRLQELTGAFDEKQVTMRVAGPPKEERGLVAARATVPYRAAIPVQGREGARWTAKGGLPDGLLLAPEGVLVGTPSTAGEYRVTVVGVDAKAGRLVRRFDLTVEPPPSMVLPELTDLHVTVPVLAPIRLEGARDDATFALLGDVPPGLELTGAVLGGVPTVAGRFTFTVRATDRVGAVAQETRTVSVAPAPLIVTADMPVARVGLPYSVHLETRGTDELVMWSIDGHLPPGLSLSGDVIEGTARQPGTWTFRVMATDRFSAVGNRTMELVVEPAAQAGMP